MIGFVKRYKPRKLVVVKSVFDHKGIRRDAAHEKVFHFFVGLIAREAVEGFSFFDRFAPMIETIVAGCLGEKCLSSSSGKVKGGGRGGKLGRAFRGEFVKIRQGWKVAMWRIFIWIHGALDFLTQGLDETFGLKARDKNRHFVDDFFSFKGR